MKNVLKITSLIALLFTSSFALAEQNISIAETINIFHEKALRLKNEGKYNEAEDLFKKIVLLDPKNPNAQFDLGNVYLFQKRYAEATKQYEKAKELGLADEFIADYYFNISMCHGGLGNSKEAIGSIKQCLKINPEYPSAKDLLGLYKDGKNFEVEPVE